MVRGERNAEDRLGGPGLRASPQQERARGAVEPALAASRVGVSSLLAAGTCLAARAALRALQQEQAHGAPSRGQGLLPLRGGPEPSIGPGIFLGAVSYLVHWLFSQP